MPRCFPRLVATRCPPIRTYSFDFGPFAVSGSPGTADAPVAYCPRRTVLDKLLVDAAADPGADVRERFTVDEVLFEGVRVVGIRGRPATGDAVEERAAVVVGADGLHSLVAEAVRPEQYDERPPILAGWPSPWPSAAGRRQPGLRAPDHELARDEIEVRPAQRQ